MRRDLLTIFLGFAMSLNYDVLFRELQKTILERKLYGICEFTHFLSKLQTLRIV